jgi:hypothetical protein
MILICCFPTLLNFNLYMLLCGNNALKQKIFHSSVTYYVHSQKQKLAALYMSMASQAVQLLP